MHLLQEWCRSCGHYKHEVKGSESASSQLLTGQQHKSADCKDEPIELKKFFKVIFAVNIQSAKKETQQMDFGISFWILK